jgi:triacylglycerol lipase
LDVNEHTKGQNVWFTGHSLGAALTTLAMGNASYANANLVTFGSPRVGNANFRDSFFCRLRQVEKVPFLKRYVHGDDIVPEVPLESMGYVHIPGLLPLKAMPRPWENILIPRKVFDHIPTNYAERIWEKN